MLQRSTINREFMLATILLLFLTGPWPLPGLDTPGLSASALNQPEGFLVLSLSEAVGRALQKSPILLVAEWDLKAVGADVAIAGISPFPEIELEVGKFGGNGEFNGFDSAETTLSFTRAIEGSGKRSARVGSAEAARSVAAAERMNLENEVCLKTATAFYEALAKQEILEIKENDHLTAGQIHESIKKRVVAGKVSPVEEARARVLVAFSAMELGRARGGLLSARKSLASNWGNRDVDCASLAGELSDFPKIPCRENLEEGLARHPALNAVSVRIEEARAALKLAGVSTSRNIFWTAGISNSAGDEGTTFKAGIGTELTSETLRNAGISKAKAVLEKALVRFEAVRLDLESSMDRLLVEMGTAVEAVDAFEKEIIPSARLAHDAARKGYEEGTTGYLEVLDTRRTLAEARSQFVLALLDYHCTHLKIEALAGCHDFGEWLGKTENLRNGGEPSPVERNRR